jgi:hypothetical protein
MRVRYLRDVTCDLAPHTKFGKLREFRELALLSVMINNQSSEYRDRVKAQNGVSAITVILTRFIRLGI